MTVEVVHAYHSPGFVGSGTSYVLNLAAEGFPVPDPGDVLIAFWSHQTNRSSTTTSGAGATWTRPYSGGAALSIWVGTGATTNGNVTFNANSTGAIVLRVFLVRGLAATTLSGPSSGPAGGYDGNPWNATPVLQAGNGQIAFSLLRGTDATLGAITYPHASSSPASGWTFMTGITNSTTDLRAAYRTPNGEVSADHDLWADGSLGDSMNLLSIVFGDYVAPSSGPNLPPGVDAMYVGADPVDQLYVGANAA